MAWEGPLFYRGCCGYGHGADKLKRKKRAYMILSTQTDFLARAYGEEEAIRMLARAGFDAYDFSFFAMFDNPEYPMNGPGFREYAQSLRAVAEEAGIACNQAHAPFASSTGDAQDDQRRFEAIVRSMEAAALLGAKVIVVHPKHHLPYAAHAAELREMNVAFYKSLVPYCEKFGIKAACENMWQHNPVVGRIIDSTCSRPQEFCDYIDQVGSPWVVGCLDVGHVALTDEDLGSFVRAMGPGRLQALHVHDNDFLEDLHTMPFTCRIDFSALAAGLKEIGYAGDFTLEADHFLEKFPLPLVPDALGLLYKVGRFLADQSAP